MKHVPPRLRPATVVVAVATATATIVCLLMLWMRPHCSPAPLPAPGTAQPSCPANCLAPASGALLPGNASLRVSDDILQKYLYSPETLPWSPGGHPGRHTIPGLTAAVITSIQRKLGIHGAVGEIGVHHGAYFLSLALTARKDEQLWALDIFEQQGKNVDDSGKGDFGIFSENVKAIGIDAKDMLVTKKASTEFSVSDLCDFVPQRFRFLSIDGGHTREIVYNDLKFAECYLAEGGVASLDDYTHPYWVGVHEGVIQYFAAHGDSTRLAPFFLGANKLYVTTKSFHAKMLQAMINDPIWRDACNTQPFCIEAPGVNGGTLAKFQLAGWGIAVTEHRAFDDGKVLAYWKSLLSSS